MNIPAGIIKYKKKCVHGTSKLIPGSGLMAMIVLMMTGTFPLLKPNWQTVSNFVLCVYGWWILFCNKCSNLLELSRAKYILQLSWAMTQMLNSLHASALYNNLVHLSFYNSQWSFSFCDWHWISWVFIINVITSQIYMFLQTYLHSVTLLIKYDFYRAWCWSFCSKKGRYEGQGR